MFFRCFPDIGGKHLWFYPKHVGIENHLGKDYIPVERLQVIENGYFMFCWIIVCLPSIAYLRTKLASHSMLTLANLSGFFCLLFTQLAFAQPLPAEEAQAGEQKSASPNEMSRPVVHKDGKPVEPKSQDKEDVKKNEPQRIESDANKSSGVDVHKDSSETKGDKAKRSNSVNPGARRREREANISKEPLHNRESGLAIAGGVGYEYGSALGIQALLYVLVADVPIFVTPHVGLAGLQDVSIAMGVSGAFGARHRLLTDISFGAVDKTELYLHCTYVDTRWVFGISGAVGYEYMANSGFLLRLLAGADYPLEDKIETPLREFHFTASLGIGLKIQ